MKKTKVFIHRCTEYHPDSISSIITEGLHQLGGRDRFFTESDALLLKPNLLIQSHVSKGVCTPPEIVEGFMKAIKDHPIPSIIGDSPGFGKALSVMRALGYNALFEKYPLSPREFSKPVEYYHPEGKVFKNFIIDELVVQADKIINLARLKTHGHMGLTLAVKNTFGYVVGPRKFHWHLRSGVDMHPFATMLVSLHYAFKPTMNIVDGIIAMDGNGPQHGKPYPLGIMVMGEDGIAVDRVICEIVGFRESQIPIFKAARDLALGVPDLSDIEVVGTSIESVQVKDFVYPDRFQPDQMIPSKMLTHFFKEHATVTPKVDSSTCVQCGVCVDACPPKAMSMNSTHEGVNIQYKTCIRCYCCHELCPEGAIDLQKGWILKLLNSFGKKV